MAIPIQKANRSTAICRFAEPISLTSIFPYLPEMIESLNVPATDIAFWAGAATAVYSLSQCLTAIAWGTASDRYGRKYIILLGLLNTMITSLLWGFSTSLPMALVARALSGAGNGNVGIIRTMVAEMVPYRELQPRAFSVMPLVFNIGSVLGPSFGGALSNPLKRKPTDDPRGSLLWRFPYALPNIVSACFFLFGIIVGALFLHETLAAKKGSKDYGLVLGKKLVEGTQRGVHGIKKLVLRKKTPEEEPLLQSSTGTLKTTEDEESAVAKLEPVLPAKKLSYREVMTKQTSLNLLVYTLLAMHSIAFDQLLSVFLHHPRSGPDVLPYRFPLRFNQGFGLNSGRIGLLFTVYGMCGIFYQFVLFPFLASKYGVLNCLRAVLAAMPVIYILAPFSTLVPSVLGAQGTLFALWMIKGLCSTFAFPCSTIMLTNSASSMAVLGTVNGIATSFSAIGRAAGPTIGGAAFTWGAKKGYMITPFWTLAFFAALTCVPAWYLVDGEGFGDEDINDEDTDGEDGEDIDTADEQEEDDGKISSYKKLRANSRNENGYGYAGAASEDDDSVAPLGGLLSRETSLSRTRQTDSLSSSFVTDSEGGYVPDDGEDDQDPWPTERNARGQDGEVRQGRRRRESSRPSSRRSSVPIGMGAGFRRMSSNLGQTRSGLGTGGGLGGA
ncbi:Major facilitator superfamily [Venturia nashicola]|uniref:Major facilitator superfamily n=1 Tax=Venturia nashicola TaxID=86259 RepID=A0A4Z1PB62_9PEZI|nr:Major facilitator superfamily [Venturia nashicola]